MKKVLIFTFFYSAFIAAQDFTLTGSEESSEDINLNIDQTDIASLIQTQIDSALALNERGEIKSSSIVAIDLNEEKAEAVNLQFVTVSDSFTEAKSESYSNRIIIISVFTVVVLLVVFIRRIIKPAKLRTTDNFKEKFIALRNENLLVSEDRKLEEIRKKLTKSYDTDIVGSALTIKAKELGISHGELMLVAKIKAFQLSEISEGKT